MPNIILLGKPGSGKGTQAKLLVNELKYKHISTGDVLRHEIQNKTNLSTTIKNCIDTGNFVPDNIIDDIIYKHLNCRFVLDGYPRNTKQYFKLAQFLQENNKKCTYVYIQINDKIIIERLSSCSRGRQDDKLDIVKKRLLVFWKETYPVICLLQKYGLLYTIEGNDSIEKINDKILELLKFSKEQAND